MLLRREQLILPDRILRIVHRCGNALIVSLCSLTAVHEARAQDLQPAAVSEPFYAGVMQAPSINEASGMAASNHKQNRLWLHNDSGHESVLYATDHAGAYLGKVTVKGILNRDWEDIASFRWRDRNYLMIADTGDNLGSHEYYELVVVQEPLEATDQILRPAWKVRFQYEDGPMDCEAVAVDEAEETIYLITKRTVPAHVYAVPLRADGQVTARRIASTSFIPQPTESSIASDPSMGRYRSQPTGMDMSANKAVVLTYKHAYLFEREARQDWGSAFAQPPQLIPLPFLLKGEAIAFTADGDSIFATSEVWPAPLIRIDFKPSEQRADTR